MENNFHVEAQQVGVNINTWRTLCFQNFQTNGPPDWRSDES
jgi:hypothetical protein